MIFSKRFHSWKQTSKNDMQSTLLKKDQKMFGTSLGIIEFSHFYGFFQNILFFCFFFFEKKYEMQIKLHDKRREKNVWDAEGLIFCSTSFKRPRDGLTLRGDQPIHCRSPICKRIRKVKWSAWVNAKMKINWGY